MDHPKKQIPHVVHTLCEGSPSEQKAALETYFTPDASFTHPICCVPSFSHISLPLIGEINSRWVLWMVYRWYKILSPKIILTVEAAEFNQEKSLLFLNMHQKFHPVYLPFYTPTVHLTTVLSLTHSSSDSKYYIQHQEDLYQTSELVKFVLPIGIFVWLYQLWATFMCILGAQLLVPVTWWNERRMKGGKTNGVGGGLVNGTNGEGLVEKTKEWWSGKEGTKGD